MLSVYFGLLLAIATAEAYYQPKFSSYHDLPYNNYNQQRRSEPGNYYGYDQAAQASEVYNSLNPEASLSGSWGPYMRQQHPYWSQQAPDASYDRTLQGVPSLPSFSGDSQTTGSGEGDSDDNALLRAAMPALVGGVFAVALSSIFQNSLTVNATTNETFPQLFTFPQIFDPYNPPRIVRRDADGNQILENGFEVDQEELLQLIGDSECARAKLSCYIGERVIYFTREQGLLENFINPDLPSEEDKEEGFEDKPLGEINPILEDVSPDFENKVVPERFQKGLKSFMMKVKGSDCSNIIC